MARYFLKVFSVDDRSLALLRIAVGLLVAWDMAARMTDLAAHYTDQGVCPIPTAMVLGGLNRANWSLQYLNGTAVFNGFVLGLTGAVGLALAIGWHSRSLASLCWLFLTSVQNRTPNNTGGDSILQMLLLWAIFLPIGRQWSVDWFRAGKPSPRRHCTGATVALLLQVCSIYWFASIFKNHDSWRTQHTAVQLTFGIESFQLPPAAWLLGHPDITALMTRATLFLQEVVPLFALAPTRFWAVRTAAALSFMGFHLVGLGLTMRLGFFPWVAAAAWLPFLPSEFLDWIGRKIPQKPPKANAGKNALDTLSEGRPSRVGFMVCQDLLPAILFFHILWWNLGTAFTVPFAKVMPEWQRKAGRWLGINQNWKFFSPRPATRDGWYVASATLKDGSTVDPLHEGRPVSWEKPKSGIRAEYANPRWHKYLNAMFYGRNAAQIRAYADYVIRQWNEKTPSNPVVQLEIYFMLQDNFFPKDGLRKVRMFPFRSVTKTGEARFEGDIRQDQIDKEVEEAARKKKEPKSEEPTPQ